MNKEFKPNAHVLVRIAEAFYYNRSIKKTHLHFASRTDWNSFEKYLIWLQDKNYVVCQDADEYVYMLTSNGREMLHTILVLHEKIKRLQSIIDI